MPKMESQQIKTELKAMPIQIQSITQGFPSFPHLSSLFSHHFVLWNLRFQARNAVPDPTARDPESLERWEKGVDNEWMHLYTANMLNWVNLKLRSWLCESHFHLMLSMVVCLKIFDEMNSGATFKHFFKLKLWADIQIDRVSASHESFKTYSLTKWLTWKKLSVAMA